MGGDLSGLYPPDSSCGSSCRILQCQHGATNELVSMVGAMLLQHMHDLTDQETVEQFSFNIQWHYALDITSNSDCAAYVCPKSIWTIPGPS
ncbi:MAG: transposase [Desulfocapsa sp.]|nr:transposase [Desulfocapsa sp.]